MLEVLILWYIYECQRNCGTLYYAFTCSVAGVDRFPSSRNVYSDHNMKLETPEMKAFTYHYESM